MLIQLYLSNGMAMIFHLNKHKQLIKFVSLSVVVHILVLLIVSYQTGGHKLKKAQPKELKPRIIQAQLIYQKAVVKPERSKSLVDEKPTLTQDALQKNKVEQVKPKEVVIKADEMPNRGENKSKPIKEIEPSKTQVAKPKSVTSADIRAASKKYLSKIPDPPPFNPQFSDGSTSIMAINNKARPVPQHHKSIDSTGTMGAPKPTQSNV